jgi:hypothetical protein
MSCRLPVGLVAQAMINIAQMIMERYRFFIETTSESIGLLPACTDFGYWFFK